MLTADPSLKKLSLWNIGTGALEKEIVFKKKIVACQFSPDDRNIAISDNDGITRVFSTETLEFVATIGSKKSKGVVIGWNKAGTTVLIQAKDGKGSISGYDSTSGNLLFDFPNSSSGETSIGNTSTLLLTKPKNDNSVLFHLWETDTGKLVASVPRRTGEKSAAFIRWSADDSLIAVTEDIKTRISIWNVKGERLQTLANSSMPMEFSHNGRYLVTGGISADDPKVDMGYIWELVP
jgi:WD40 repeat protein